MKIINEILLVLKEPDSSNDLIETLTESGINKIEFITADHDIYAQVNKNKPDALIIETEYLSGELLQQIRMINQNINIPIILFTETNDNLIIEKAIKYGVTTYIVGSIETQRIKSILQVAVTRCAEIKKLKNDLTQTKAQLKERKVIDKAKGILMQHKKYSEDDAYKALRKLAMDKNKRIIEIAEGIVATFDLLS